MARKGKHITHQDRKDAALRRMTWESAITDTLKKSNLKGISFEKKIRSLFDQVEGNSPFRHDLNNEIFSGFFQLIHKKDLVKRKVFRDLLLHLDKKNCGKLMEDDTLVKGLYNIALNQTKFIREIADWQKTSHNPNKQFSALLRHLFCAYPVPQFLDSAWTTAENKNQRAWLTAIGVGISIRKLNHMPITMTKKIAHEFGNVPEDLTVSEALRWAQVIGKGGDKRLAEFIYQSPIGRNGFRHETFWDGAIQFFINAGTFDYHKIDEVADYIMFQRTENLEYSLKGRTVASLIRASDSWHKAQDDLRNRGGRLIWEKSGVAEFFVQEGEKEKQIDYSFLELLSTNELVLEGKKMSHCVATYASSCYRKRCTIFSIRKKDAFDNEETLGTIEISLQTKRIVQAKARYNKQLSHKALTLLKKWAIKEKLTIPNWILSR